MVSYIRFYIHIFHPNFLNFPFLPLDIVSAEKFSFTYLLILYCKLEIDHSIRRKMVSVAELVTKLHSNIDEIHKTIALISDTSNHDAEITRLERDRDEQLQQLKMAHDIAMKEGEEARLKQEQEIEEQIKREEDEIIERRKREDEERKLRIENEVKEREKVRQEEAEKRKAEFQSQHKEVEDEIDEKMERLEDELEQQMIDGQKALETLDSARRVCLYSINFIRVFFGLLIFLRNRKSTDKLTSNSTFRLCYLKFNTRAAERLY